MHNESSYELLTSPTLLRRDVRIGPDPHRPGPSRWRLLDYEVPIWALIGYLQSVLRDDVPEQVPLEAIRNVADVYHLPVAAVEAAIDFYLQDRRAIDVLLATNIAAAE